MESVMKRIVVLLSLGLLVGLGLLIALAPVPRAGALYAPKSEALTGVWNPPAITVVKEGGATAGVK
jgi:hypothetical protein